MERPRLPVPRNSGCVRAHPPSWRASASYRPLRAVWAVCAWALRGFERDHQTLQRPRTGARPKRNSANDHRQQVREGPRHRIRHHPARRRAVPRRHHDVRGKDRDRRDARRHGRRRHRGRLSRSPPKAISRRSARSPAAPRTPSSPACRAPTRRTSTAAPKR